MKNFVILITLVFIFSSCSESGKRKRNPTPRPQVVEPGEKTTQISAITPIAIGVTPIEKKFTPFPDCDGGECVDIAYTIAVKTSENQTKKARIWVYSHDGKGEAAKDPGVIQAEKIHKEISSGLTADNFRVVISPKDGEITRIFIPESFEKNQYYPEITVYQRP